MERSVAFERLQIHSWQEEGREHIRSHCGLQVQPGCLNIVSSFEGAYLGPSVVPDHP